MKLFEKILQSSFWKSVITLSAGQVIGQAITLFSTPIVSRLYSTEEYGAYGILVSTATIIIGIIGLGLGSAIMVAEDEEQASRVFRVTFFLQFLLAAVLCIGLIVISPVKQFFVTSLSYAASVGLMFLYILGQALMTLLNVYVNRLKKNKVLFLNPLITALCTLVITIPCGLLHMDFLGLMFASIAASFIACGHMLFHINPFRERLRLRDVPEVIRKNIRFVLYQYPANLIGTVSNQLPNQTLSNNFGNAALGSYAMCNKLFNLPLHLIATPIQTVYFRTATQEDQRNLPKLTFSLVQKISLVAFLPSLAVIFFGEPLFAFVLGSDWAEAGRIAGVLVIQYVFTFCGNCIAYCRVAIGKQNINLYTSVVQILLIFASLWLGLALNGTLLGVIQWFAVFNTVFQMINIGICFICMKAYVFQWFLYAGVYCVVGFACIYVSNFWF